MMADVSELHFFSTTKPKQTVSQREREREASSSLSHFWALGPKMTQCSYAQKVHAQWQSGNDEQRKLNSVAKFYFRLLNLSSVVNAISFKFFYAGLFFPVIKAYQK